jgi:hypothetical protein
MYNSVLAFLKDRIRSNIYQVCFIINRMRTNID